MEELSRCGGGVTLWAIDSTWSFLSLSSAKQEKMFRQNIGTKCHLDEIWFLTIWTSEIKINDVLASLNFKFKFEFKIKLLFCFPLLYRGEILQDLPLPICLSLPQPSSFSLSFSFPSNFFSKVFQRFFLKGQWPSASQQCSSLIMLRGKMTCKELFMAKMVGR